MGKGSYEWLELGLVDDAVFSMRPQKVGYLGCQQHIPPFLHYRKFLVVDIAALLRALRGLLSE